jgi:hypothetical protein
VRMACIVWKGTMVMLPAGAGTAWPPETPLGSGGPLPSTKEITSHGRTGLRSTATKCQCVVCVGPARLSFGPFNGLLSVSPEQETGEVGLCP